MRVIDFKLADFKLTKFAGFKLTDFKDKRFQQFHKSLDFIMDFNFWAVDV